MAGYGKRAFDEYIIAIVSELVRIEERYPDWPDDLVSAARIVSGKAGELLSASTDFCRGDEKDRERILKEAIQTGAITLRFLLNADDVPKQEMITADLDGRRQRRHVTYL